MKRRKTVCKAIAAFTVAALVLCAYVFSVAAAPSVRADVEGASRTMPAYVKSDKRLGNGFVQFLADEVLWIDGADMPNNCDLDNAVGDWVPCAAAEQTGCSLWQFVPEDDVGFMESVEMSLDEFVAEMADGWREGMLLAKITVSEGVVESIFEEYTP